MSENGTDAESVHDDDHEISKTHEDSGSEYHSDDASSVQSEHSTRSDKSSSTAPEKKPRVKKAVLSRIVKPTKATYSGAYRDFYNDMVENTAHPFLSRTHALPASDIGVVTWTPLEKEILFNKVSIFGKDNIKAISEAIRTKSETEVHQYLVLLDQGTVEGNVTKALPVFSAADVPAAFEVSKQSEDLLEEYADGLAQYQTKSDQKREKKRHGDYWLLTEEIALEVEEQVMARDESYLKSKNHDQEEDETEYDQETPKPAPEEIEIEQNASEEESKDRRDVDGDTTSQSQEPDKQSTETTEELMVPAAEILDLPMWLRLSRLFMYQPPSLGDNWTNLVTSRSETPSMYHTTFQDFYNLTISLTRRLVQTAIFQTMTRLRARDKDQPSAAVTATDVRAAIEILDLQANARKFWGGVPRRHGLRVYERAPKFSKGHSRAGAELSLEDAEEKLGVGLTASLNAGADENVVHTVEHEVEEDILDPNQYHDDPELWTEGSGSEDEEPTAVPEDQPSGASEDDEDALHHPTDDEEAQEATRNKRRRKGQMERNFQKAHDAYLEAMDQETSRVQEIEMWDTLGVPPPNEIKNEEIEIPRQPVIKRRLSDTANWRDGFEYRPPWETGLDAQPEDFVKMQERGEQARKRRRLAYDYLEKKGLVLLTQKAPENTRLGKKTGPIDVDVETNDAPTEKATSAPINPFNDGVPRKKHPNPVLTKVQSRASSARESSHDSSRESVNPTNQALANTLMKRIPVQQIEDEVRRVEEQRKAKERVEEEKRKSRAALKTLPEDERNAIGKERKEEKRRKAKEKKRVQEEKQKARDEKQRAKEEKRRAREGKRRAKKPRQPRSREETAQELATDQTENGREEEDTREEFDAEETIEPRRKPEPQSKKSKRKSGF